MPAGTDPRLPYREIDEGFLPPRDPILGYVKVGGKSPDIRHSRAGKPWVSPIRLLDPARFEVTTREKISKRVKGTGSKASETFTVDLGYQRNQTFHDLDGIGPAPSSLRVRLMYPTARQNMIGFLGAYGGGKWVCRGNGSDAVDVVRGECVCPCPRLEQFSGEYDGTKPNDGRELFPCKPRGQLHVILEDAGIFGGFWAYKTTSFESISNITKALKIFEEMFGRVDGLPLELRVQAVTKQLPKGGTTTQPIVTIVLASSMNTARQVAADAAAESRKFLPAGGPLEESEFREAVVQEMQDELESTVGEFSTPVEELETLEATEVEVEEGDPSVEAVTNSGDPDEPTGTDAEEEGKPSPEDIDELAESVAKRAAENAEEDQGFEEPASAHRTPAPPPAPTTPNPAGDSDRNEKEDRSAAEAKLAVDVLVAAGWKRKDAEARVEHQVTRRTVPAFLERLEKGMPAAWAEATQTDLLEGDS